MTSRLSDQERSFAAAALSVLTLFAVLVAPICAPLCAAKVCAAGTSQPACHETTTPAGETSLAQRNTCRPFDLPAVISKAGESPSPSASEIRHPTLASPLHTPAQDLLQTVGSLANSAGLDSLASPPDPLSLMTILRI